MQFIAWFAANLPAIIALVQKVGPALPFLAAGLNALAANDYVEAAKQFGLAFGIFTGIHVALQARTAAQQSAFSAQLAQARPQAPRHL